MTGLDLKFSFYMLGKINPLLRTLELFSLDTRKLWGIFLICTNTRCGRRKEDGIRLFLVVPVDRTRHNRHKPKYGKFYLNIIKKIHCESGQTLQQAAQRGCGLFILGDTQNLMVQSLLLLTLVSPGDPSQSSYPVTPFIPIITRAWSEISGKCPKSSNTI